MFKPVSNRFNVTLLEEEILRFWKTQRVFEKRYALHENPPSYTICEPPPAIGGKPDLQDALARVHRDLWLRYQTMRGKRVQLYSGWQAHGLLLELSARDRLGLSSREQTEQYGVELFNDFCLQLAQESIHAWETLDERLNGWRLPAAAPVTHSNQSIEAVWALFEQAWDRGLVYQDERVTPYCPRCGMVLADYEVVLGTQQIEALSAIIRLPLLEDPSTTLLVWTDRVWSLPGNVAVAVNPEAEYVIVERDLPESGVPKNSKPEKLILAKALLERVFGNEAVRVYETFRGSKLKGLKYRPLFQFLLADKPFNRVVLDNLFVSETGSGLVQLAPAFDAHARQLAIQNDLPVLTPVAPDGTFVTDVRPWRGVFFKDAEVYILQDLQERGLLYRAETHYQESAFCLGCGSPLLPYIRNAWYLRMQAPRRDWTLSRERFWGTPLPLWQCIKCNHQLAIGSVEQLSHLAGRNLSDLDLHRPFVDDVAFACPHCDGLMRRVPQVLDAQWDAAALSLFQLKSREAGIDPADLVCEVTGQAEGWFYGLHTLSSLFFDGQAAYLRTSQLPQLSETRDQLHAHHPLSDPWDIIHDHGADALRWVLLSASPSDGQVAFSNELLAAARDHLILPLWNVYSKFISAAIQVSFTPPTVETEGERSEAILDRWLSSRLHWLVGEVTNALEAYDSHHAASFLQEFVTDLAGWYLPGAQRRLAESAVVAERQAVCASLYQALVILSRLFAPFLPFLAEELYQKLVRTFDFSLPLSVHLTDWPVVAQALLDPELDRQMALAQRIVSLGRSARQEQAMSLYQPLPEALVTFCSSEDAGAMDLITDLLADALLVRQVSYVVDEILVPQGDIRVTLDTHLTIELLQEGLVDEFVRRVQDFRQKAGFAQEASINLYINATPRLAEAIRAQETRILAGVRCVEIKLVSQQPDSISLVEQGRTSRRVYTMVEFEGERATFGIEKVADH